MYERDQVPLFDPRDTARNRVWSATDAKDNTNRATARHTRPCISITLPITGDHPVWQHREDRV